MTDRLREERRGEKREKGMLALPLVCYPPDNPRLPCQCVTHSGCHLSRMLLILPTTPHPQAQQGPACALMGNCAFLVSGKTLVELHIKTA